MRLCFSNQSPSQSPGAKAQAQPRERLGENSVFSVSPFSQFFSVLSKAAMADNADAGVLFRKLRWQNGMFRTVFNDMSNELAIETERAFQPLGQVRRCAEEEHHEF